MLILPITATTIRTFLPAVLAVAVGLPAQGLDPRAALPEGAPAGIGQIDRAELLRHATFLASDQLGGRLTGSPGQVAAANYIAHHFEKLALEPLGDVGEDGERGWFQSYRVARTFLGAESALVLGNETIDSGFGVLPGTGDEGVDITGAWTFVPPRAETPDLEGVIPVVWLKTPKLPSADINAVFSSALGGFMRSRAIARKLRLQGAKAVVFCLSDDGSGITTALNYFGVAPGKHLLSFGGDGGMADMAAMWKAKIPQVFLSKALSQRLLAALEIADPTQDEAGVPVKGGLRLALQSDDEFEVKNVVGLLRGSDPELRKEVVVYSAHMDHVGRRIDGEVFNGADDNASGTSGLLEVAQAFTSAPPPRRSILFLSVSGEELGLWGSKHFSDHPTWPVEDIVADINIDMIGRVGPESDAGEVTVTPSYHNPMFSTMVRDSADIAAKLGMAFRNGDKYYTRSDHYNFARLGIPVVFFCSGEHEDYHQVTDHADKLDGPKMEKLARIAYWTGVQVAQADERPQKLGRRRGWDGESR